MLQYKKTVDNTASSIYALLRGPHIFAGGSVDVQKPDS